MSTPSLDDLIRGAAPIPVGTPINHDQVKVVLDSWLSTGESVTLEEILQGGQRITIAESPCVNPATVVKETWMSTQDVKLAQLHQCTKTDPGVVAVSTKSINGNSAMYQTINLATSRFPTPHQYQVVHTYTSAGFKTALVSSGGRNLGNLGTSHEKHLSGGFMCIPSHPDSPALHRDAFIYWLACYRAFEQTGSTTAFRKFDS
jgi:hypothetical protein